jgi:hypothetical protein
LKGVQAFSIQLVASAKALRGGDLAADLEMMMTYAYEGIYESSYIGEILEFEQKLWKISCQSTK